MRDGSATYLHALRSFAEELTTSTGIAFSISKGDEESVASAQKLPIFDPTLSGDFAGALGELGPDVKSVPLRLPDGEVCTLSAPNGPVALEVIASVLERHLALSQEHREELDDLAAQLLDAYEEINLFFDLAAAFGAATDEAQLGQILLDRLLEAAHGEEGAVILSADESLQTVAAKGRLEQLNTDHMSEALPELRTVLSQDGSSNTSPEVRTGRSAADRPTMITPVLIDGSPVGAVVIQKSAADPFLAGELKVAQSLSTQAGVFLNNLR